MKEHEWEEVVKEHEWEEYCSNGRPIGIFKFYICKNCGAGIGDLFYRPGKKIKKIKILGSNIGTVGSTVYLTEDCEESQKRIQQYWEKETKKKGLYKQYMRRYSK